MIDHMQTRGAALRVEERTFLVDSAKRTVIDFGSQARMVNIGVEYGASIWCLLAGAPAAAIYAIDRSFTRLIGVPNIIRMEGKSQDSSIRRRIRAPIHLVFVDGSHEELDVLADAVNFDPKVITGGMLIFHDYHNPKEFARIAGVARGVNSWFEEAQSVWAELEAPGSIRAFHKV